MNADIARALASRPGKLKLRFHQPPSPDDVEAIGQLDCVVELQITADVPMEVPPTVARLTRVTILRLIGVPLPAWLPELPALRWLEAIHVDPASLGVLSPLRLTTLSLSTVPALTAIPDVVLAMTSLTSLELGGELTAIPDEIRRLRRLKTLWAQNHRIDTLAPGLFALGQLETLWLGRNCLRELPPAIGQLTNLRELLVDHNQLEHLPAELGALRLARAGFAHNRLAARPSLANLAAIDRNGELYRGNPFTERTIPAVPLWFGAPAADGAHRMGPRADEVFAADVERCAARFVPVLAIELATIDPGLRGQAVFLYAGWNGAPLALARHTGADGRTRLGFDGPFDGFDETHLAGRDVKRGAYALVRRDPPAGAAYAVAQPTLTMREALAVWRDGGLRAHFGATPVWTQNDETPSCPRCAGATRFIGQVRASDFSDELPDADLFLFLCVGCDVQVTIQQRT